MSKQLECVGIQTNEGSLSENCCTSQFVYLIYTGAKRDPIPHWENGQRGKSLQFVEDLKGARLNGGVQIE